MFNFFKNKVYGFLRISLVILFSFCFSGCPPEIEEVLNPVLSPPGGTYSEARYIEILCNTPGVTMYYTLDGTEPTIISDVYSYPIYISENIVIKAFAEKKGIGKSGIVKAEYVMEIIEPTETPTPVPTDAPVPTDTPVPTTIPTETPAPTATPILKYNYTYFSIDDNEPMLWMGWRGDEKGFTKPDKYYGNVFQAADGSDGIKELYILINTNEPGEYNSINNDVIIVYFDDFGNEYYTADADCKAIVKIDTWTTDLIEGSFAAILYSDSNNTYIMIIGIFKSFDSSEEARNF